MAHEVCSGNIFRAEGSHLVSCWCRSCTAERAAPGGDEGAAGRAPAAPAPVARLCPAAIQSWSGQGGHLPQPKSFGRSTLSGLLSVEMQQGLHLCQANLSRGQRKAFFWGCHSATQRALQAVRARACWRHHQGCTCPEHAGSTQGVQHSAGLDARHAAGLCQARASHGAGMRQSRAAARHRGLAAACFACFGVAGLRWPL